MPFYSTADFTAEWISPDDARYTDIHRIAPFSLTNQLGQTVTNETLRGKVYVANFFFTECPSICPKMLPNLRRIQDAFRDDDSVVLVSHSVWPSEDTVDVLKAYAEKNQIQAGKWHLLTGDESRILELARKSYFAEKEEGLKKKADEFLHTENMLLIDRQGRIRGIFNATVSLETDRMIDEIRQLQKE